ncbi:hypothetical protein ACQJBY_044924 [Aegilops geniculata]
MGSGFEAHARNLSLVSSPSAATTHGRRGGGALAGVPPAAPLLQARLLLPRPLRCPPSAVTAGAHRHDVQFGAPPPGAPPPAPRHRAARTGAAAGGRGGTATCSPTPASTARRRDHRGDGAGVPTSPVSCRLLGRALVATAMGEGSGEWWRRQTRKRERDVKRNGTVNQDRWNARGGAVVVTHRCCVSGIQLQQDRPAHLLAIHSRREDAEQSRAWPAVEALVPLNGSTVWCGGEEDGDGGCRGGCWRR